MTSLRVGFAGLVAVISAIDVTAALATPLTNPLSTKPHFDGERGPKIIVPNPTGQIEMDAVRDSL